MPLSEAQICNMALAHVGHTQFIANLETEQSNEANVCGLFYEQARDFVLEDYPWPFATRYATLNLIEEDPNNDWDYSYRYPSDCVFVRRLVTALGRENTTPPPFKTGSDDSGRLIYTDEEDAVAEYTKKIEDPAMFPALFGEAVSWYLSGLICPGLAKDRKQAVACFQMYEITKGRAQATAGNEQQQTTEPESEFIRARE